MAIEGQVLTLAARFASFQQSVLFGHSKMTVEEVRSIFYSGAHVMHELMHTLAEFGKNARHRQAVQSELDGIRAELERFNDEMIEQIRKMQS